MLCQSTFILGSTNTRGCLKHNSWCLTKRGTTLLVSFIIVSIIPTFGMIPKYESKLTEGCHCVVTYPQVYHPIALYIWNAIIVFVVILNILLLIIIMHKLRQVYQRYKPAYGTGNTRISVLKRRSRKISELSESSPKYKNAHNVHFKIKCSNVNSKKKVSFSSKVLKHRPVAGSDISMNDVHSGYWDNVPSTSQTSSRTSVENEPHNQSVVGNDSASSSKCHFILKPGCNKSKYKRNNVGYSEEHDNSVPSVSGILQKQIRLSLSTKNREHKYDQKYPESVASKSKYRLHAKIKLLAVIVGFFILCYTPYLITLTLYTFCPDSCGIPPSSVKATGTITLIHGIFNFGLYVIKNKPFRKTILQKTCCFARKS